MIALLIIIGIIVLYVLPMLTSVVILYCLRKKHPGCSVWIAAFLPITNGVTALILLLAVAQLSDSRNSDHRLKQYLKKFK